MDLLNDFLGFLYSKFNRFKTLTELIGLESKLAQLSIVPLLCSIIFLGITSLTLWLSLTALLGYGILVWFHEIWIALTAIIVIHIGLIALLINNLKFNIHNMSFVHTRAYLAREENHAQTETVDAPDRDEGAKLEGTAD